jgi:hypothetical protein
VVNEVDRVADLTLFKETAHIILSRNEIICPNEVSDLSWLGVIRKMVVVWESIIGLLSAVYPGCINFVGSESDMNGVLIFIALL